MRHLAAKAFNDIMISFMKESAVAQVVVRQLEKDLKERLKRRAERHGRSVEAEIREILRNATAEKFTPIAKLGSRIAKRFRRTGLRVDLPELRGQTPRGVDLGR